MGAMTDRAARIETVLRQRFSPTVLQISDDSARHAGHAGASEAGETHYSVMVVSEQFAGLGRVERHRLVNQALEQEFGSGLHALALTVKAPGE